MPFDVRFDGVAFIWDCTPKNSSHQQGFGCSLFRFVQGNDLFGAESLQSHILSA